MNATGLETTRFRAISEREQRSVPTCQENHHQWNAQLSPTKARRESGQVMTNVPSQDLLKRLAVEAWRQVEPERVEPESVEILKWSKKSMVYRLAGVGNAGTDVIAKRCCAATAKIERAIYEELLPRLPVPALRCYGAVQETAGKYAWLFLEEAGRRRYSPLSEDHRVLAGRWLGAVHGAALRTGLAARLPGREPGHYLSLLRSVRAKVRELLASPALPEEDLSVLRSIASQCDVLESHWGELEKLCCGAPRTVVHGDLVVKNVRVRTAPAGRAFLVFGWQIAGWGVPATDLAQFTGHTVSPDFAAYCAALEKCGCALDIRVARRLAQCGRFFRLLDAIGWASLWVVGDSYSHLERPLALLRTYSARLAEALRAARWTESAGHWTAARLLEEPKMCRTLRNIATRLTEDAALRDDLMQESLIRLWKLEIEQPGRTRSWYMQNCWFHVRHWLASGRSLDSPKRANANKRVAIDEISDELPADCWPAQGGIFEVLSARDIVSTLARHLKPREGAVLESLADGLTLREIAVKLKLSYPTALKCRRKIAELTIKLGIFDPPPPPTPPRS